MKKHCSCVAVLALHRIPAEVPPSFTGHDKRFLREECIVNMEEEVLAMLEESFRQYISGEEMARRLFITRAGIWKIVRNLRSRGYAILSSPQKGYCLSERKNYLASFLVRQHLGEGLLTGIEVLKTVDSTNNYAKKLAASSGISDYLVLSEEQTAGKGRRERSFYSPAKTGVYMSYILRPDMPVDDVQLLTICAALAVCDALESLYDIHADIKWLNDVYIGGKKVCGILTEGDIELELFRYKYIVVGIGVNTERVENDIPESIRSVFTAISDHTKKAIDRNPLAAEITRSFFRYYRALQEGASEREKIVSRYRAKSCVLGKTILLDGDRNQTYTAWDISPQGQLIVESDAGERRTLNTGEISIAEEKKLDD